VVLPLLGYFFSMVAVLAAAVGVMIGLSNASTPRVRHYPVVEHNVTAINTEPHLFMVVPETKNGSPAKYIEANSAALPTEKADTKKSKPHKPALAHQLYNYERPGYGNALGYAQEFRSGAQRLFSSW
jgi:hypothetical protein